LAFYRLIDERDSRDSTKSSDRKSKCFESIREWTVSAAVYDIQLQKTVLGGTIIESLTEERCKDRSKASGSGWSFVGDAIKSSAENALHDKVFGSYPDFPKRKDLHKVVAQRFSKGLPGSKHRLGRTISNAKSKIMELAP
jgi:hypothetical protein